MTDTPNYEIKADALADSFDAFDPEARVARLETEIEALKGKVAASGRAFARPALDGAKGAEVDPARTGKFGFDDLRRVALGVLDEIAASALRSGLNALGGGTGGGGAGGVIGGLVTLATSLLGGAPGRATGGPVSPARPYRVGEYGPELFVPTSSGRIIPHEGTAPRDVRVHIAVSAPQGTAPQALSRSARQIARSVRGALSQ